METGWANQTCSDLTCGTGFSLWFCFRIEMMTLEELEREYVSLRQQADAVRSYL
jgi:hypothetical protein